MADLSEKHSELRKKTEDELEDLRKSILTFIKVFLGIEMAIVFGIYATPAQMKCGYHMGPLLMAVGAGIVNFIAVIALAFKSKRLLKELMRQPSEQPPGAWVTWHNFWRKVKWFGGWLRRMVNGFANKLSACFTTAAAFFRENTTVTYQSINQTDHDPENPPPPPAEHAPHPPPAEHAPQEVVYVYSGWWLMFDGQMLFIAFMILAFIFFMLTTSFTIYNFPCDKFNHPHDHQ